jgi:PAS domain-containing protein
MKENLFMPNQPKALEGDQEQKTVIDYLMRENVALKEKIKILENQKIENNNIVPKNDLFNRIMADSLLLAGRISDGIITQIDGKWNELMGYDSELLIGKRYDREDLIHPDELKRVKKIEDVLKRSSSISQSKYSTIQRWKHGKTNHYVMLSMIWEIDVSNDSAVILAKPIDDVISD